MKGQGGVENVIGTIVGLFMFLAVYPALDASIQVALPTADPITAGLLRIVCALLLIWISIRVLADIPSANTGGR